MSPTAWELIEPLSLDVPKSITWASRGPDGGGKSYFACTAPSPIFVCAFDPHGMSRVDPGVREGKDIRIGRYGFASLKADDTMTKEQKKAAAKTIWDQFVKDYMTVLPFVRTVLWDREDLAWELMRYQNFGADKNAGSKTGQLDYGDLNAEYVGLIQLAKEHGVNLGLLQGYTEEWISKFDPQSASMKRYNSGKLIPDGFKKIPDHVDITTNHRWDPALKEYVTSLAKFPNKDWKDQEFPNLSFAQMATLAFPTTSIEDWE